MGLFLAVADCLYDILQSSFLPMSCEQRSKFTLSFYIVVFVRDQRKISEHSDLADVCKVSVRFAVRMCRLERCRKAAGSETCLF